MSRRPDVQTKLDDVIATARRNYCDYVLSSSTAGHVFPIVLSFANSNESRVRYCATAGVEMLRGGSLGEFLLAVTT